ncbi:hypothetical protein M885DRAFT_515217 [Pelagophyceae sp. CCMP2097]|nr:hypothetical protein M885DRAFT_515217 [Pelagophyceae sp. CCMP2097]
MAFEQQPWFTNFEESSETGTAYAAAPYAAPAFGGGGYAAPRAPAASVDLGDEVPLLEELGVDFGDIWSKTKLVLRPSFGEIDERLVAEADLAGPVVFGFCLGGALLLHGKVHFGYIYGFGVCSCVSIYLLLNLMASNHQAIEFAYVVSFLGYCLLPVVALAATALVLSLKGALGSALAATCVLLCTWTATRLFEAKLHMRHQRCLIAYPLALVYSVFVLITIF